MSDGAEAERAKRHAEASLYPPCLDRMQLRSVTGQSVILVSCRFTVSAALLLRQHAGGCAVGGVSGEAVVLVGEDRAAGHGAESRHVGDDGGVLEEHEG